MIDINGCENGKIRIQHVHGIQPTTEPYLQNPVFYTCIGERNKCRQCAKLEIGQTDILARLLNCFKGGYQNLI